ncbi:hypothetical protein JTB14_025768 [Gonioctena quinquepunctata]|nr:hypothetical protein JTB14_025768 [Gonioctena quinquepunctata]
MVTRSDLTCGVISRLSCERTDALTLEKAPQMAFSEDLDIDEIYIEPPVCDGALTDEDSGDEDNPGLIDNLSGKQLTAKAEKKNRK